MRSWVWLAAVGTGSSVSCCSVRSAWVLGAGQSPKERLSCSPRTDKGRGVMGEEVLGSNNFIKNGMSFLFKGEGGRSNHDGNLSAGKGDAWSVAIGQVEHPQSQTQTIFLCLLTTVGHFFEEHYQNCWFSLFLTFVVFCMSPRVMNLYICLP